MKFIIIFTKFIYNLGLAVAMRFYFVPHLPRLDKMVAKFFICKRKVSNFISLYFFIYFIFIYFTFVSFYFCIIF